MQKRGTEDLENNLDAAQFINTSKGVIVRFSENEDFTISNALALKLGFSELTIERGIYDISYGSDDFGTLELSVKSYKNLDENSNSKNQLSNLITSSLSSEENDLSVGLGIRIAKRHKRTCGGEPVDTDCLCGIGFRCGLVSLAEDELIEINSNKLSSFDRVTNSILVSNDIRVKKAVLNFNKSTNKLSIHFLEKVDWEILNN